MAPPLSELVEEQKFWPILTSLLECLRVSLDEAKGPGLCYCGLYVGEGQPPMGVMNCSSGQGCGIAWVRPANVFPSLSFPEPADPAALSRRGTAPLAMEVEIGVARCMPRPAERSVLPDPQHMYDAARLYMSDLRAMDRAIRCCFAKGGNRDRLHALGQWTPIPAGAGISGGAWSLFVG